MVQGTVRLIPSALGKIGIGRGLICCCCRRHSSKTHFVLSVSSTLFSPRRSNPTPTRDALDYFPACVYIFCSLGFDSAQYNIITKVANVTESEGTRAVQTFLYALGSTLLISEAEKVRALFGAGGLCPWPRERGDSIPCSLCLTRLISDTRWVQGGRIVKQSRTRHREPQPRRSS